MDKKQEQRLPRSFPGTAKRRSAMAPTAVTPGPSGAAEAEEARKKRCLDGTCDDYIVDEPLPGGLVDGSGGGYGSGDGRGITCTCTCDGLPIDADAGSGK